MEIHIYRCGKGSVGGKPPEVEKISDIEINCLSFDPISGKPGEARMGLRIVKPGLCETICTLPCKFHDTFSKGIRTSIPDRK